MSKLLRTPDSTTSGRLASQPHLDPHRIRRGSRSTADDTLTTGWVLIFHFRIFVDLAEFIRELIVPGSSTNHMLRPAGTACYGPSATHLQLTTGAADRFPIHSSWGEAGGLEQVRAFSRSGSTFVARTFQVLGE
ncbi:hypothetical protein [Streptomyces zaomyceticus]|uniref:hypothetical protein n=1 Tax=Streptomyces zaomyceticus TaxID=68286 RepID=UPI0036978948